MLHPKGGYMDDWWNYINIIRCHPLIFLNSILGQYANQCSWWGVVISNDFDFPSQSKHNLRKSFKKACKATLHASQKQKNQVFGGLFFEFLFFLFKY